MGKRAGLLSEILADAAEISASRLEILPNEHSVPPTGMKNVEMRTRRRNYVIDFSNFEVNISIKMNAFIPMQIECESGMKVKLNRVNIGNVSQYRKCWQEPFVSMFPR